MVSKLIYFIVSFFKGNTFYARKMGVLVGENCRIYTKKFGSEPFLISIGNNVTITSGVRFITHDGSTWLTRDSLGRRYLYRKVVIGDNVFIGMNSILMPGVNVGNSVIIAAGSVVTKSVPSNSVIGGNPARYICSFESYKEKSLKNYKSDKDLDWASNYEEMVLKNLDNSFKEELSITK